MIETKLLNLEVTHLLKTAGYSNPGVVVCLLYRGHFLMFKIYMSAVAARWSRVSQKLRPKTSKTKT